MSLSLIIDGPSDYFFKMMFGLLCNGELLPTSGFIRSLGRELCGTNIGGIICENVLFLIAGFDSKELNQVSTLED